MFTWLKTWLMRSSVAPRIERKSRTLRMTFSNFAPMRMASYSSFVPPSIENVSRVISASTILAMERSLSSRPFVMMSLKGTP